MSVLLSLWFVWLLLGGVSLIYTGKSIIRSSAEAVAPDVDLLGSETFAAYIASLFADLRYQVQLIQDGHDYGANLILERERTRIVVHTRRQNEYVGVAAVQQVVAAKAMYDCAEAMVVTNTMYTHSALHLAQANRVVLWDRPILLSEISNWQDRRYAARLQARALHRLRSLAAIAVAGVLLSVGLVGFWRQEFSAWSISNQPIANSLLPRPGEPGLRGVARPLTPTASIVVPEESLSRSVAVEERALEDVCGTAVVQGVTALAIREGPSRHHVRVGEVRQGGRIKLVCEPTVSANGIIWQLVDYDLGRGWMSRKYLVEQP